MLSKLPQLSKATLRKKYIALRQNYTSQQIKEASNNIFCKFIQKYGPLLATVSPIRKFIHIFLPIENKKEIDTTILVDKICNDPKYQNVYFVVPKMTTHNSEPILQHYYYHPFHTKLEVNKYGVPEPTINQPIMSTTDLQLLNFIIVPLLCWHQNGHRIGYGGGYYDKFLSNCSPNTLKIGVSLFPNEPNQWDTNEFDIKLDDVIIPEM